MDKWKCPLCSSPYDMEKRRFTCGQGFDLKRRTGECFTRQITQLKELLADTLKDNHNLFEENANLKERLEAWRVHWREDHGYETLWTEALRKLEDLGEI